MKQTTSTHCSDVVIQRPRRHVASIASIQFMLLYTGCLAVATGRQPHFNAPLSIFATDLTGAYRSCGWRCHRWWRGWTRNCASRHLRYLSALLRRQSISKRNVRFVQFDFDQCLHGHSLPPPVDSQAGLQLDFRQWVQREVTAGNIAFTAKGEAPPEQPQGGELPEQSVAAEQPAVAVARVAFA